MIFELDEIVDVGLALDLSVPPDRFDINQSDCSLTGKILISGFLNRLGKEVYLKGRVRTGLNLSCSRCLKLFNYSIDAPLAGRFVPKPHNQLEQEHEIKEGDIDTEYYCENKVNISQPVQDSILLDVPMNPLCREGCMGLCDRCGKDLNQGSCSCDKEPDTDPRLEILQSFKENMK